ncbi:solute carrier family 23 protein [Ignatzschineria indica]|uniref:solute carrier family 23 protein n=1 Tax=Ignatzschineria indica TaxID=472583 RepID=UPI003625A086
MGGPPVTTYGEVTGAVMLTKNDNPLIMTYAAIFAIFMAFFGKFNAFLNSIPLPVYGWHYDSSLWNNRKSWS